MAMRARGDGKKRPPAKTAARKKVARPARPVQPSDEDFSPEAINSTNGGSRPEPRTPPPPQREVHDLGGVDTAASGVALALRDMAEGGEISSPFGQAHDDPSSTGPRKRRTFKEIARD